MTQNILAATTPVKYVHDLTSRGFPSPPYHVITTIIVKALCDGLQRDLTGCKLHHTATLCHVMSCDALHEVLVGRAHSCKIFQCKIYSVRRKCGVATDMSNCI